MKRFYEKWERVWVRFINDLNSFILELKSPKIRSLLFTYISQAKTHAKDSTHSWSWNLMWVYIILLTELCINYIQRKYQSNE